MTKPGYEGLPGNLPVPVDDGAAAQLPGQQLPALQLTATDERSVALNRVGEARWILFVYPATGVPGTDMPAGWDEIPGARGCTPEACGFRDSVQRLHDAGAHAVFGLSGQSVAVQREAVSRLHLPYPLLSDPDRRLGAALRLPTFTVAGQTFYKRLTLIVRGATIEHAFYPVFPPDTHAADVAGWLEANPAATS